MKKEQIISMAREAGFIIDDENQMTHSLERFAALVAAAKREAFYGQDKPDACRNGCPIGQICDYCQIVAPAQKLIAKAVAAEREACAKVCEIQKLKYEERAAAPEELRDINPEVARTAGMTCDFNAAAIRARGQA